VRPFRDWPGNLRGAALMVAAGALFACEALCIRWMTERGIATQTQVLARAAGQFVWILPGVVAAGGLAVFRTRRLPLHLFRGSCSLVTWGLYFLSFAFLDLATATVLSFTNVLFTTLLAGPVLGERVDRWRWAGTLIGLLGVALMLRPGGDVSLPGALVALGAALAWCGITLSARVLSRTESTMTVLAWVGLVTTLGVLPFAIAAWRPLGAMDVLILLGFAAFTPGILWLLTEALRAGEASAVAPFQYVRLLFVAGLGWLIHSELPPAHAWLGGAVILIGALLVTIAEARRQPSAATAASSGAGSKPNSA
jgi:drug/metabolite transporter (DMT)-like permease